MSKFYLIWNSKSKTLSVLTYEELKPSEHIVILEESDKKGAILDAVLRIRRDTIKAIDSLLEEKE